MILLYELVIKQIIDFIIRRPVLCRVLLYSRMSIKI